ncbi:nucleotidyltransferase domain-containing protein [Microbacterium sp. LRZ72]|uniref:nucleotidyltransferase domain-containing protein n=1 Tax=Microbacterium sp. LRZ72 TaxID=2942481 RepID=UPI0029A6B5AE|nr:nucleotidyltransferase domain-containing protein [Microbacterium sp. LRZ72]MDX2375186.1 nucleotidyltransferase domain-containing protein [Microbacterium sp. LRZ72]
MSAVEAAVLRVLARSDAGFSGRQVHALAGTGSTSSVHRALAGFVHVGLVTSEARPPAIIYRANREHVLWPSVEMGLTARSRVFESIRGFLDEIAPREVTESSRLTVLIYGSVARRDSSLDSDIDLLLVYPDGVDSDVRADLGYRLAEYVAHITGNETQVFSLERAEFDQRLAEQDAFLGGVVTDGIHIYGPTLAALSSNAA